VPADLRRPICDLLGCNYPVVLAGMGGVARSELVIAVTEAGGFGFLGMVREPVALIRAEVERVRARTRRSFGVNLIPAATDRALLDAQLAECIALDVPVVCLFWDLVPDALQRLRDAGIVVICQIGSAAEAQEAQAAGAQALIAQGREAGGHVRGQIPRNKLLSEVLDAVDIPVLAAGGIVDGADLAAILSRGADGAVVGTAFLATEESFAHDYHKRRILDSRKGETVLTDVFHVNWPIGAPVRVLWNSVTEGRRGDPFAGERTVIGWEEARPIYLFSTDSPLKSMTGDFEAMALYAGMGVGRIDTIPRAGDRLRRMVTEAAQLLDAATQ
jgi:nitronate monooxygenase